MEITYDSFYLCKVKYEVTENEKSKIKTLEYLVRAISVTDADKKIHEYLKSSLGDFDVASVVKSKIEDVIGVAVNV